MMRIFITGLIFVLLAPAQALALDMDLLKRETQVFEGIIASVLRQDFDFFEIDAAPKAAYLDGFGVAVDFRLKINRSTIRTPFGERPRGSASEPRTLRYHIQTVRASMVRVLAEYGDSIRQLEANQRIAITAHLEDRSEIDPIEAARVLVFSVAKNDIEEFSQRKLSLGSFTRRVSITEY